MSLPGIQSAVNFLVPAAGTTHMFPIFATFAPGSPFTQFFDQQAIDGQRFMPSGVFIDNSAGANPITVTIQEISWNVTCPAGGTLMQPYPAPSSQHATITGNGIATVVFVDFPVQPFIFNPAGGGAAVTIANGADVALGATTDAAATTDTGNFSLIALFKRLLTKFTNPANANVTTVAAAAADTLLLAANSARQGAIIWNDSTSAILYVRLDTGAATTGNYSAVLAPGGSLVLAQRDYAGEIRGIWAAATGFANVTEFSA